jgi:hypothetical protein
VNSYPPPRTNPPGNGISEGWFPGQRYSYSEWSRAECSREARGRAVQRARIAQMTDTQLTSYLGSAANAVDVSWSARTGYRAAWHEITRVRGAIGVPRL